MNWNLFFAVFALLLFWVIARFSYRPHREQRYVTDEAGRIVIFHGINVISAAKADPQRVGGTTKADFQAMADKWGFNAVRLLIFWDAIEPRPGQYDQNYLARVRRRLDWCAQAGLAVVLDMHQDLYALQFGGDGAPLWAVRDDDQAFVYQTPWELNYRQPAVRAAIENFWMAARGHPELQSHFIQALLAALAALGDHPAVVGIDLYNEPTLATLYGILHFERRYLTPFLQRAIDAIREQHPDLWIFYEPAALGPNQGFRSDLGRLHDPRPGEPRLVYFPHLYTLDLDLKGQYLGRPLWIHFWAHQRRKEARRRQTPMMVGEFGLGEDKPGALAFLDETLKMFDAVTSGWFYWSYDRGSWGLENEAGVEMPKAGVLVRPYPRRIAGRRPAYRWQPAQRVFSLSFDTAGFHGQAAATEIYLPPRAWPQGWRLVNTGVEIAETYNPDQHILSIRAQQAGEVRFHIEEAAP